MAIKSVTIASERVLRFPCAPLIHIFRIAHPGFSQVRTSGYNISLPRHSRVAIAQTLDLEKYRVTPLNNGARHEVPNLADTAEEKETVSEAS